MQRRLFSSRSHRRLRLMLLASTSLIGCVDHVYGDSPVVDVSSVPIPAERAGNDVELLAPTNSTLEIRVARRPWLFDRLTKPEPAPSIKMNPPRPPREVAEPPTAKQIILPESDSDAWMPRETDSGSLFTDSDESPNSETPSSETPSSVTPSSVSPSSVSPSAETPSTESPSSVSPSTEATSKESQSNESGRTPGGTAFADVTTTPSQGTAQQGQASQRVEATPDVETLELDSLEDQEHPADNEEPLPLVDPVDTADQMETADLKLGLEATKSDEGVPDEELLDQEVTVRKLRINRDGTPAGGPGEEVMEGEGDDEVSRNGEGASIGDLPEEVTVEDSSDPAASSEEAESLQADLDYTGYPRKPIRLTSSVQRIQGAMRQCLRYYYARPENANERSNWGMLHAIMVYGADTKIIAGNKSYSAIAWIAGNNPCRGQKLIEERDGRIAATSGIGLQGHQAQMLAILALSDVPADYPLYAGNRRFTVSDLVQQEMLACRSGEELTFTLIGLSHYLDTDAIWKNESGEIWDFERLIREELGQPIVGAACGGTHRLMGYGHALRKRRAEGRPISGQWKRADVYVQDFVRYVYRLQNRDGSMSTDWFEGREDNGDVDRKIQTTGHMVEWLLTVTPDSQLQDQRLVNAVRFLLSSMYNERTRDWKVGPKGHALRSLAMYYERVYQQGPAWRATGVATGQSSQRR